MRVAVTARQNAKVLLRPSLRHSRFTSLNLHFFHLNMNYCNILNAAFALPMDDLSNHYHSRVPSKRNISCRMFGYSSNNTSSLPRIRKRNMCSFLKESGQSEPEVTFNDSQNFENVAAVDFLNESHLPDYHTSLSQKSRFYGINEKNWRSFSHLLTESIILPSISVPSEHVHCLLSSKLSPIKKFLATRMEVLEGLHPKIKVVKDDSYRTDAESKGTIQQCRKRIILSSPSKGEAHTLQNRDPGDIYSQLCEMLPHIPSENIKRLVCEFDATPSTPETISIEYQSQSVSRILSKILPQEAQPPPSSYEQIGHVAHVNLRSNHVPHRKLIGSVMLDRLQPKIRSVVNKIGEVGGPFRTYQLDLLAGENNFSVHVSEHGASLFFDLTKVYWCTRLEGERTYMIENEFKPNQLIADAFCGVGALCIRAVLEKKCRVIANDLNPDAVTFCYDSASYNGIDVLKEDTFSVQCGDARDFIMNLGISMTEPSISEATVSNLPDHLILNFPLNSPAFLNALRWWPLGDENDNPPRVHVYTFARADQVRTAAEVAIDMVANGLMPEGGYVEPSIFRGKYLNKLGCRITAREIRDAAPGKMVICVSFSATRLLLRRIQGDY